MPRRGRRCRRTIPAQLRQPRKRCHPRSIGVPGAGRGGGMGCKASERTFGVEGGQSSGQTEVSQHYVVLLGVQGAVSQGGKPRPCSIVGRLYLVLVLAKN